MDVLPDASLAVQITVVNPIENCFGALFVTVICSISTTVGVPNGIVLLSSEVAVKVILAGMINLGAVVSTTSIVCVPLDVLPDVSLAVHNIVVFPSENVFDALLAIVTGWAA